MKISFLITSVNSRARYHPGLASLSAVLKQAGYQTDLIDLREVNFSSVENYINSFKPDIIAASTNTHQYPHVKDVLEFINSKFRHIKLICGGVHPTIEGNVINEIKGIDATCRSEGESPILEYVKSIEKGENKLDIPNINFKRNGETVYSKRSYFVDDLNKLPFPDYSIFPAYKNTRNLHFPMRFLFNRGCPFNCTYCCNHILKKSYPTGKYVRYKKPQRVVEELLYFSQLYNFDHYVIDDDVFTLNKKWLMEFCNLCPESLKSKTFEINVRVGTVNKEMAKALKDVGCSLVKIGLESGNEEIRGKILGKRIKQDEIIATADMLKEVGIGLHTFNMIGIPGETRQNVWDTIRLNRRIKPDKTQLTVFYPYPYTVLGDYCFNKKLVHKKSDDSYFTSSVLKRNGRGLSLFEIKHFVSFFKIYVFWGWNRGKVREEFRRLIKKSLPYTIMDKVKKRLERRLSIQEEFSAKEIEMKYWKKAGLSKGKEFYKKYLELFGISTGDFADKSVGDFGCGPFGGIISVLNGFKKSYPIDILADEYNKWNVLAAPLIRFDGVKTDLPDGILDILFLTNVIDHTRYPQNIIKEAYRLLRKGGTLCLHVHLRSNDQLNKAHPVAWDEKLFLKRFEKFKIDWYKTEDFDWINDDKYRMLYGKLIK